MSATRIANTLILTFALAGCDPTGESYDEVSLTTDQSAYMESSGAAMFAEVRVENLGLRTIHLNMCDVPDFDYDNAAPGLERQEEGGEWTVVRPAGYCPTTAWAEPLAIVGGDTVTVARLYPASEEGRYRYRLQFAAGDGVRGEVLSNEFTVTIEP
jgi:hypothetical protein